MKYLNNDRWPGYLDDDLSAKVDLAAGASETIAMPGVAAMSMHVIPAATATVTVSVTLSPVADVNAGTAVWKDIASLTAVDLVHVTYPVTAVRISTATAGATFIVRARKHA